MPKRRGLCVRDRRLHDGVVVVPEVAVEVVSLAQHGLALRGVGGVVGAGELEVHYGGLEGLRVEELGEELVSLPLVGGGRAHVLTVLGGVNGT